MMKIVASGVSDIGRVRSANEDSFGLHPDIHFYVIADGMGGHAAGEVASKMAVETISAAMHRLMETEGKASGDGLVRAVKEANQRIFEAGARETALRGMGTTLVALLLDGAEGLIASVGDSRAYLVRGDLIEQITRDHSLVNDYVDRGILTREEAEHHPMKHVISRALGTNPDVEADLRTLPLAAGDGVLLCSDGLSNKLSPKELLDLINQSEGDPESACKKMVDAANRKGGEDNITLILALCRRD
jgi:protein phosphatase